MAFVSFIPIDTKPPIDVVTTSEPYIQLLRQLKLDRHLAGGKTAYGKKVTTPWVDQAEAYFIDANNSSWKSAGLLYYYSFLNLAKALIVDKHRVSGKAMRSTNIMHGLSAKPQNPARIVDYEIEIHPPVIKGKKNTYNIFTLLYEELTCQRWPFGSNIRARLGEFASHCNDISLELQSFYQIPQGIVPFRSLLRVSSSHVWFEILSHNQNLSALTAYLKTGTYNIVSYQQLTKPDKADWLGAYHVSEGFLGVSSLIRFASIAYTSSNRDSQFDVISNSVMSSLRGLTGSIPKSDTNGLWNLVPKVSSNGQALFWHPLLSDYLFAYVLSTILRYHPHLLSSNHRDEFIAESWCGQSPTTALRYFLMEFTDPPIRLN